MAIVPFVLVWQGGEFKSRGSLLLPGAPPTSSTHAAPGSPLGSFSQLTVLSGSGFREQFSSMGLHHGSAGLAPAKLQPVRIIDPSVL